MYNVIRYRSRAENVSARKLVQYIIKCIKRHLTSIINVYSTKRATITYCLTYTISIFGWSGRSFSTTRRRGRIGNPRPVAEQLDIPITVAYHIIIIIYSTLRTRLPHRQKYDSSGRLGTAVIIILSTVFLASITTYSRSGCRMFKCLTRIDCGERIAKTLVVGTCFHPSRRTHRIR